MQLRAPINVWFVSNLGILSSYDIRLVVVVHAAIFVHLVLDRFSATRSKQIKHDKTTVHCRLRPRHPLYDGLDTVSSPAVV